MLTTFLHSECSCVLDSEQILCLLARQCMKAEITCEYPSVFLGYMPGLLLKPHTLFCCLFKHLAQYLISFSRKKDTPWATILAGDLLHCFTSIFKTKKRS